MVAGWCGATVVSVGSWLVSVVMHCCPAALQGRCSRVMAVLMTNRSGLLVCGWMGSGGGDVAGSRGGLCAQECNKGHVWVAVCVGGLRMWEGTQKHTMVLQWV
ncbi:hypothetical protein EDB86DRAFT_2835040 [Lactarius hatsudake]|nr:hypothetical protein EDB86DRAFT_2835040 [Lactarius hatsudake]